MLGFSNRALALIALNGFTDAIGVAIFGVFSEIIYRVFVYLGVLNSGLEYFPLLGCFAVSGLLVLLRLPSVVRAVKAHRQK